MITIVDTIEENRAIVKNSTKKLVECCRTAQLELGKRSWLYLSLPVFMIPTVEFYQFCYGTEKNAVVGPYLPQSYAVSKGA
ncbi:hypothetical protein OA58_13110 [Microcystis aeruginosa NIES-88]|nr:hypothetical protein OA58_13110 [Microcystis aeruginosa NIES-88]